MTKNELIKIKNRLLWQLGYKPLKEKKEESIITTVKKSIRTRKSRELEAEIENIMFECKLFNSSGEYACHINTDKKSDNHFITMWKLPRGLNYKNYIEKQQVFSDNLTAFVNIESRKGLLKIEVVKGLIPEKVLYNFNYEDYKDKYVLPVPVGFSNGKQLFIWDLIKVIHVLICGETGGGKTTLSMCWIDALLQNPYVKIFCIDLALKSFFYTRNHTIFAGDLNGAQKILIYLMLEMERRKKILTQFGSLDVVKFNKRNPENMLPYLILFVDEFAFTSPKINFESKEVQNLCKQLQAYTIKLSSLARSLGIHLVIGMQKPSKDLIPKEAKDNFPGRISFKTGDQGHSMSILGNTKAFYLPDIQGRMIAQYRNSYEIQGMLIDDETAEKRIRDLCNRKDDGFVSERDENKEKGLLPR